MKKHSCLLLIIISFVLNGCASIVSKSQWPVTITSTPTGATVTVKDKNEIEIHKGMTPVTVTLPASSGFFQSARYNCQFEKTGYYPTTTSLSANVNGWYVANILFGGLIGLLIVDPATGAMWKLDETIDANLSVDPSQHAVTGSNPINEVDNSENIIPKPEIIIRSKYDFLLDSVVVIMTGKGLGSGFFVSSLGHIITNAHVVGDESIISVKMRNGQSCLGHVLKRDSARDLALIQIQGTLLNWLILGSTAETEVGDEVLAIGAPEKLGWSVSKGIISAYRSDGGIKVLQTDAAINHGNSGGPLINPQTGHVLGINTFGFRKDLAEGLNFAISVDEIETAFPDFKKELGK